MSWSGARRHVGSVDAMVRALRPSDAPWALVPATRAALAVAVVALLGVLTDRWVEVGLMYFGAACAAVFVTAGVYRTRILTVTGQAVGAGVGLALGVLSAGSAVTEVTMAVLVGIVAGAIGCIGPVFTTTCVMAAIGLGFGQFGGVDLTWWQQAAWYFLGAAVVGLVSIAPWVVRRDHYQRAAVADIVDAAADLLAVSDSPDADGARRRLAASSAAGRAGLRDHRLRSGLARRPAPRRREQELAAAEALARVSAGAHAGRRAVPDETVAAVRRAGAALRDGRPVDPPVGLPGPDRVVEALADLADPGHVVPEWPSWSQRLRAGVRAGTCTPALVSGLRVALCLAIATAVTAAWHDEPHSYWLPLTVAVIVRPGYASVFGRTVNRIAGTLAGALVATVVLLVLPAGWPTAFAAAASIGFAVAAVPRLYAFSVVGVTCSALLSAGIGSSDPVFPLLRLVDTVAGAVIALVFGYLLWPGRRLLPETLRLAAAARAADRYLAQAVLPPDRRTDWVTARDEAFGLAHASRAAAYEALIDPPPTSTEAAAALPQTLALESVVDDITRVAVARDHGETPSSAQVGALRDRIAATQAAPGRAV